MEVIIYIWKCSVQIACSIDTENAYVITKFKQGECQLFLKVVSLKSFVKKFWHDFSKK
jgi:hypothetical protein